MSLPNYKIRMLVVEDNIALAENMFEFFNHEQYVLDFAADGLTALHLLATNHYDIVVLDVMLPGVNGFEICRRIRHDLHCSTPIILVTAKDQISDKEIGFSAGADDYLVKPFNLTELRLRVQALTRRGRFVDNTLSFENLRYEPDTFDLYHQSKLAVTLTGLSARIFEALLRAYPRAVSYEQLVEQVWAGRPTEHNTVRTHVSALRKQIQEGTILRGTTDQASANFPASMDRTQAFVWDGGLNKLAYIPSNLTDSARLPAVFSQMGSQDRAEITYEGSTFLINIERYAEGTFYTESYFINALAKQTSANCFRLDSCINWRFAY